MKSSRLNISAVTAASFVILAGCSTGAESDPALEAPLDPLTGAGKADASDRVSKKGALPLASASAPTAAFTEDLEFHGFELGLRAESVVTLEVTQKGSSRTLDTTLYVYGPRNEQGAFGNKALAFDDDTGYGRLSKLKSQRFSKEGIYLIVVGTRDGRGRGNYRLQATCDSGECSPIVASSDLCHPGIRASVDACVNGWLADSEYDPSVETRDELIAQCADPEIAAPAFDALCAGSNAPTELCSLDMEHFTLDYLPHCRHEAVSDWLDQACVFGDRYRDIFGRADALVVVESLTRTAADSVSALEGEQILAAVRTTAYSDVTTLAEAFEAVDQGEVNRTTFWDASNRKAYTAVEVGAGDNSFGMIFRYGTTETAARINDGDFYECTTFWGPEHRRCTEDAQCSAGAKCFGGSEAFPLGRCTAPSKDDHPAKGSDCVSDEFCPIEAGLICQGATVGSGLCGPAWMRGRFNSAPELPVPDNAPAGVTAQVLVFGLATVSTDVRIHLLISHPRPSDLRVTLTNPATTESLVFDGAGSAATGQLFMDGAVLQGFPGDESVNGVWTLTVVDTKSGKTGTINEFGLDLTSRWD